jgi:hypothetical protein
VRVRGVASTVVPYLPRVPPGFPSTLSAYYSHTRRRTTFNMGSSVRSRKFDDYGTGVQFVGSSKTGM